MTTVTDCPAVIWLNPTAESKFADQVHAVAVLPGSPPPPPGLAGGSEILRGMVLCPGVLVAAVGRHVVVFGLEGDRLKKYDLAAVAQPVTCLSAHPNINGDHQLMTSQDMSLGCLVMSDFDLQYVEAGIVQQ